MNFISKYLFDFVSFFLDSIFAYFPLQISAQFLFISLFTLLEYEFRISIEKKLLYAEPEKTTKSNSWTLGFSKVKANENVWNVYYYMLVLVYNGKMNCDNVCGWYAKPYEYAWAKYIHIQIHTRALNQRNISFLEMLLGRKNEMEQQLSILLLRDFILYLIVSVCNVSNNCVLWSAFFLIFFFNFFFFFFLLFTFQVILNITMKYNHVE